MCNYFHNYILGRIRNMNIIFFRIREYDCFSGDILVHKVCILMIKGRNSNHHLINENSQGPPIDHAIMTLSCYDLWSQIFRCPTKGHCSFLVLQNLG